jgi:hypothetical protein
MSSDYENLNSSSLSSSPGFKGAFGVVARFGDRLDLSGIIAAGTYTGGAPALQRSAALPSHDRKAALEITRQLRLPQPR